MADEQMPPSSAAGADADQQPKKKKPETVNKKIAKQFKKRIETSKKDRKTYIAEWKRNIDTRMGQPGSYGLTGTGLNEEADIQSEINPDWSLTKTKTANLFSQVPTVRGTHENKQYAVAVAPFMKSLNYEIGEKRANAGAAMEEAVNDVVNASGFGAIFVGYSALFETTQVPAIDVQKLGLPPQAIQQAIKAGKIPMKDAERVSDDCIFWHRISPSDALWPKEFAGSDFNEADYVGYSGTAPWSVAKNEFDLDDEDKDKVLIGSEVKSADEDLRSRNDRSESSDTKVVKFDDIYYWRYRVDPEEKSFRTIWRLVYVDGLDKPAVHGPWRGQKLNSRKKLVGATKYPVQFGTVTYISDQAIPPSDTKAGRPQVNDLRRSRQQMFQNRDRSTPLRWFDSNRVDTTIQDNLMRGTVQGMIPMNGDGSRAIGEIARASYPPEDLQFDINTKQDLIELWQLQPTMTPQGSSAGGKQTKAEAQANAQNFATRMGQERRRIAQFFLNCCEVTAGYMALYSDFPILTDQEKQQMQQVWNDKEILGDLVLKMLPDAQIVLDVGSRLDRIFKFINMTVKSGFVNPEPLIMEACELSGFDPAEIMIKPQPKPPEEPNISYRFSGKEDLQNPLALAIMLKQKQITPEDINAAKLLLTEVQMPPHNPQAATPGRPQAAGAGHAAPGVPPPAPGAAVPHPADKQHEHWALADKVAKRSRDMGNA